MSYVHLTQGKRYQIEVLNKTGIAHVRIAEQLGVDPSTISREIKRGKDCHGRYEGEHAQRAALRRRRCGDGLHGSSAGIGAVDAGEHRDASRRLASQAPSNPALPTDRVPNLWQTMRSEDAAHHGGIDANNPRNSAS